MIYRDDQDILNTALIISNDDIIKLKNNINNINKIILYTNVDYDNEFKKNDFFINKEIELDFTEFRRNDKFEFSKILNTNKIKKITVKNNANIIDICQFSNLEHIKFYINSEINVEDIIYKYNYPKSLKIFELNNKYKNYSLKYINNNNVMELFKIFKNKGLHIKKAIINDNTYYNTYYNTDQININEKVYNDSSMKKNNKSKTQYYNISNTNDNSSIKNDDDDNNKSRNKISNKVCYYNSSTNTNTLNTLDTLNTITVDNIAYITYYLLHLKID